MERSIDDLLVLHAAWMRRLARALVGEGWADDVVQEAWLAAQAHGPAQAGALPGWLAKVVRNAALARRREELHREERERVAARPEAVPGPAELALELEAARELAAALDALAPEARELVHLRYFRGLAPAEIARARGLNAATVRSRLHRALEELRARLDARHGGERRAWSGGLMLFAWRGEPAAAAGGLALVTGVLTMKVLALTLVSVVALSLGLVFLLRDGETAAARSPSPVLPAVAQPAAPAPAALAAPAPEPERAPRAPVAEAAAAGAEERAPSAPLEQPSLAPAVVTARCIGPEGIGLAGSRLEVRREAAFASPPAGSSGAVSVAVPMDEDQWPSIAVLTAPGRESRALRVLLVAGESTELGEVELAPAARITGWVRDPSGLGIEGARVWAGELELPEGQAQGLLERLGHAWARPEQDPEVSRALAVESGADGYFALDGVRAGPARLWASQQGHRYGWTGELEVPAGRDLEGVEIVLEPLRATDRIAGVVLDPQGAPIPRARLLWGCSREGMSIQSSTACDEEGRFELLLIEEIAYQLRASDPEDRYADCQVRDVAPGTLDLELRLGEKRWLEIEARDAAGNPVAPAHYEASARTGDEERASAVPHGDGLARLEVPPEEFTVVVSGPQWREQVLGPFAPSAAPARLACTLERCAAAYGTVSAGGRPLAGASVRVMRAVSPDLRRIVDGFPAIARDDDLVVATAADGAFRFALRGADDYWLRVEAEGHGGAFVGPLDLDPAVDHGPIEVELGEGGRLELRVVHADGSDASGRIIGLTCGDGRPFTRRAGPGGRLALDGLVPGRWLVRACEEELTPYQTTIAELDVSEDEDPIPWTLEIREGRTTSYVLELDPP